MMYVSLFTREWIEIYATSVEEAKKEAVSLFTREWIEMLLYAVKK